MKKQLLSALSIGILGVTSYAATFMNVKTKDGESVKFDVNDVEEVVFVDETTTTDTTPASNHEYVDLGLPSGTLWATYNIGATKPEEFGDYFSWGETKPKEVYDWSTYKYSISKNGHLDSLTKYNSGRDYPGVIDSLTTLLAEDDAATANWGSDWRMPTMEEQLELIDNCEYIWTEVDGVNGTKFTAKNGKSVFFPAAGVGFDSRYSHIGTMGGYWSSTLRDDIENGARYLYVIEIVADCYATTRIEGFSVRAVRAKKSDNIVLPADTTEIIAPADTVAKDSSDIVLPVDTTAIITPADTTVKDSSDIALPVDTTNTDTTSVDTASSNHEYVDLGLPSGTLWATYNIGATKPEEYGDYFAWGETSPKEVYDWSTYKYAKARWEEKWDEWTLDSLTKYNSGNYGYPGMIDSLTTLLPEDDAATVSWGSDWRMPTIEEQQELYNNCQREWTEVGGVSGAKLTASNGNSIFFPAAGNRGISYGHDEGTCGDYWSSSLIERSEGYASYLTFRVIEAGWGDAYRSIGFSVRAVRAKK